MRGRAVMKAAVLMAALRDGVGGTGAGCVWLGLSGLKIAGLVCVV